VIHDVFLLQDQDIIQAIRMIQKNERGRQGRARYQEFIQGLRLKAKEEQKKSMLLKGGAKVMTAPDSEQASQVIQCMIRGIMARK
jgi:hypothetical protein